MPQTVRGHPRTLAEQASFDWMLRHSNLLYLGCSVIVLIDLSYQSRFWPQFELWLSLRGVSDGTLGPSTERTQRAHALPIHSATTELTTSLIEFWRLKSPVEAHRVLRAKDVRVTNNKDKETMLPKIEAITEEARRALTAKKRELTQLAPAQAAVDVVAEHSSPGEPPVAHVAAVTMISRQTSGLV